MAIEQDFLPFATASGANVLTQAQYAALAALSTGYQSGVANSAQLNKTWRQSSIMSAVLAQFIVNQTGQAAIDDGTTATLLANLATAIAVSARQNPVLADTGAANAYVVANLAALSAYPTVSGLVIDVSIANTNTGASTLNVDGLGTKPIYGLALQPLQGGELIVKGVACLMYIVASTVNSGNGAWVLMECAGGAQQVAAATQSQHALPLGQAMGRLLRITQYTGTTTTWTKGAGTTALRVRVQACGGSGAGSPATSSGQASIGSGGGAGAYAEAWITGGSVPSSATVTAPAGPAGVSGTTGASGASASFGALVTAPGGNGGTSAGPSAPPFAPAAVTVSASPSGGNIISSPGSGGGYAFAIATNALGAGQGGNSVVGAGGPAASTGSDGVAAAGFGGGGGGTSQGPSAAALTGGKGGDAVVIVEEYGSV